MAFSFRRGIVHCLRLEGFKRQNPFAKLLVIVHTQVTLRISCSSHGIEDRTNSLIAFMWSPQCFFILFFYFLFFMDVCGLRPTS